MSEAYLKVEVLNAGTCKNVEVVQVNIRGMNEGNCIAWVEKEQVIDDIPNKESIQNELMDSIKYIANSMNNNDRAEVFGDITYYGIICSCDAQEIIDEVRKFRNYPASGKIYTKKRGGEDVLCMVLGVEDNWVCYTEKSRTTHGTTVDTFLGNWTYTGECRDTEVDALYDALGGTE